MPPACRRLRTLPAVALAVAGCSVVASTEPEAGTPTVSTVSDQATGTATGTATAASSQPTSIPSAPDPASNGSSSAAISSGAAPSSAGPSPGTPSAPDDSPPSRARRAQIARTAMPGFNDSWRWDSASRSRDTTRATPSLCARSSLVAIGAVTQVATTFRTTASGDDVAYQVTGVFPDLQTATTAEKVLVAWLDQCQDYAVKATDFDRVSALPWSARPTRVGRAFSRLVTAGPVPGAPDDTVFSGEGYVRDGDTITYLVLRNIGQDYNYDEGAQPVQVALSVAGRVLLHSR